MSPSKIWFWALETGGVWGSDFGWEGHEPGELCVPAFCPGGRSGLQCGEERPKPVQMSMRAEQVTGGQSGSGDWNL